MNFRSGFSRLITSIAVFSALPDMVFSLPKGAQVESGSADISTTSDSMVLKVSHKAIINYDKFRIEKGEKVRFIQPKKSSVALNRVKGSHPSEIFGNLESNGHLFLVNPYGVVFGPTAQVNVGSIVVSTLGIASQEFLNDTYRFVLAEDALGSSIVNQGSIRASNEGSVVLLAPTIKNEGVIEARAGKVILAAAETVTLDFSGDSLVSFSVEGELKDAIIEQSGRIECSEGGVYLRLKTAEKVIKAVVNTDGVEEGEVFIQENGVIKLVSSSYIASQNVSIDGGEGSNVEVSGHIQASYVDQGLSKGGQVEILGSSLHLMAADIDVSADHGGGQVHIGGDYKGLGDRLRASSTRIDELSSIKAEANTEGNGGRVIVWSDDKTVFSGKISVRGGSISGDGGFIETSSKNDLSITSTASVDSRSGQGKSGLWLLDPTVVTIAGSGSSNVSDGQGCSAGNVTISNTDLQTALQTTDVQLDATSAFNILAPINSSNVNSLTFSACPSSNVTTTLSANISLGGGALTFSTQTGASHYIVLGSNVTLSTSGGNVLLGTSIDSQAGQNLTVLAGSGAVSLSQIGASTALGSLSISAGSISQTSSANVSATVSYSASTSTVVSGNITTQGGAVTWTGPVLLGANVQIDTTNAGGSTAGANISLSNVDATSANTSAESLTLKAGTSGNVSLNVIGGSTPLGLLNIVSGNVVNTNGNITIRGNATAGGTISIAQPVALLGATTFFTTGGGVTAGNTIQLSTVNGNYGVTINAGTSGL
ncbi:MAG: filamentous hemagglutinin N-terminal domain-containing protein, partial [Chlamydiae bacterium]|nr:filamentous hemagglutinin N-terminal domain-containing protein [Chlamydiota bacterium]